MNQLVPIYSSSTSIMQVSSVWVGGSLAPALRAAADQIEDSPCERVSVEYDEISGWTIFLARPVRPDIEVG